MNDMVDMSRFVEAKSDQLNADDLMGAPRTVTIKRVTGSDSNEQPVVIHYEDDGGKPFKPCKTMRRVLLGVWGKHAQDYIGRSMTLYRDDSVTFGGLEVGGIRISHMSHIDSEKIVVVNKTRGKKAGIKILPLANAPKQDGADQAREWTDKFIANVNRAPDAGKLDAFVAGKAKLLEELKGNRPELHAECEGAINARKSALAGAAEDYADDDDDDPFAEPEDTPAETDWRAKADEFLGGIRNAKRATHIDEVQERYREVCTQMPKDLCDEVEAAIAARRGELGA